MLQKRSPIGIKSLIIGLYLLLQYACIDKVPATFDYKEDLIIIGAVALTVPGTTFATVYHRLDFSWKIVYKKDPNKRFKGDWTFTVYNLYRRTNPFNVYYSQRNGSQDASVFSDDLLGSYQLSVLKGALVSLAYNFKFQ